MIELNRQDAKTTEKRALWRSTALELRTIWRDSAVFTAGSGDYRFTTPWPPQPTPHQGIVPTSRPW
jgi:hypothetical protein